MTQALIDRQLSVAPMMDWTDHHCRYFLRLVAPQALLYTEMITTGAIIYGQRERFLQYHPDEHPLALQLGGNNPEELAFCAKIAEEKGFDEVNLNVGCPSVRVQNGQIGACLMAKPELVGECVAAMQAVVSIPVTVKTRIGIDDLDSYDFFKHFITTVSNAGCSTFIVHARKAHLKGLNPKQNRDVPPLDYERVKQLQFEFPQLTIILNGGIKTVEQVKEHLATFSGVMLGREAYQNPYCLAEISKVLYPDTDSIKTRQEIVQQLLPYIQAQLDQNIHLSKITRHILGLFQGLPGARAWRRHLSTFAPRSGANVRVVEDALALVS